MRSDEETPADPARRRAQNRARNLIEYRTGAETLLSLPQYVMVELTQGCNLSCPMCRGARLSLKGRTMSLELFERVAEAVFDTAEVIDLRGWGESLVLGHVEHCIERAAAAGGEIRFVTNLAMRRAPVDLLARFACHVAVSVDTVDPALYAILRRGGRFEQLQANLRALVDVYRKGAIPLERIVINTTVTAPGLAGLADIVSFAAEMNVREVRISSVSVASDSYLSLDGRDRQVDAALEEMGRRAEQLGVRLAAATRLGSMPLKPPGGAACMHPWSYALFAHDGGVGFCDHLNGPAGEEYILGSLHERSFEEIWNGDAWRALRREHLRDRRPSADNFAECAWCYKHRLVDFEMRFAPEFQQTLVRAPLDP